jgi:copper chaperone CopZ
MIRIFTIVLLVGLFAFSCADNTVEKTDKRVASFEVEGMVCEIGCVASLRKGLYETNAVDEVKLDYKEDRLQNTIKVFYDSKKIDANQMLEIIEEMNEGQFKAKLLEDTEASSEENLDQSSQTESLGSKNIEGLEASSNTYSLPNLTDLFNNIIH